MSTTIFTPEAAIARLPEVLTKPLVRDWLEALPHGEIIGYAYRAQNCPIYHYLAHALPLADGLTWSVGVNTVAIEAFDGSAVAIYALNESTATVWVDHFIGRIDMNSPWNGEVTREYVLAKLT